MRIKKCWIVIAMALSACGQYQKTGTADKGAMPDPLQENQETETVPSKYGYNNTGMFLMDNGMILLFSTGRPPGYRDSMRQYEAAGKPASRD